MVEKEREIIEIDDSYPSLDEKDTSLRPIFCLKNRCQLKEIEKKEECFILEFDHMDELNILKLGISEDLDDAASPEVQRTSRMVEKEREIIEIDDSYDSPDEKDTSLRPIICLRNRCQLKEIEKKEKCFILEFDHEDELNILKLGISEDLDDAASPDVRVVAEKGQVACRDYPHPRHACAKHLFLITPHDTCCELCYCYVCDSTAPCEMWTGPSGHCHAFNNEYWNNLRRSKREYVTNT